MAYGTVGGHWASESGIQTKRLNDGKGREQHVDNIKRELDGILKDKGVFEVLMRITLLQANGNLRESEALELSNHYDTQC